MKPAKKIALVCVPLAIIAVAALTFHDYWSAAYASVAAEYPQEWVVIKPGMVSKDARRLAGEPWADGRDLKIVDRWRRVKNGVEMHMDLWFEGQNDDNSVIVRVGRWKHFMGIDTEQHIDPPWSTDAVPSHGADGERTRD